MFSVGDDRKLVVTSYEYHQLPDQLDRSGTKFGTSSLFARHVAVRVAEQCRAPPGASRAYKTRPPRRAERTPSIALGSEAKKKKTRGARRVSGTRGSQTARQRHRFDGSGSGNGGEGGGRPARRVRGAGRRGGAAGGAEHADGDGAVRQEESHRQGRPGPLGAGGGGRRGGGVPPSAAAQVLLPRPPLRREPLPEQQGLGLDLPPARQGVRVHDVRGDGGGDAGVHDRAGGRARGAVDQALQHLHPLLRADRRQPRAGDARRRRHRRRRRRLRAQPLPPLPVAAAAAIRRALATPTAQTGPRVSLGFFRRI